MICLKTICALGSEAFSSAGRAEQKQILPAIQEAAVERWLTSAFLQTEKHFRKVMGHKNLWILKAALNDAQPASIQVAA